MVIRTNTDLKLFLSKAATASVGDEMTIDGEPAKQLSAALAGWHKFREKQHTCAVAGGGAIGGIAFGPVGWIVSAGCTATLLFAIRRKEHAEKEFRCLALSGEAEELARTNWEIVSNDGSSVIIRRTKDGTIWL